MSSYLVIGGAGQTGSLVVDRFADRGDCVTILSRNPGATPRDGVATATGDIAAGLNYDGLLEGVDGVVVSVEPPTDPAGAASVMHEGVAALARACSERGITVVLVSQIYITRADAHPEIAAIIKARAGGEQALRDSGAPYIIVRPAWLTNEPVSGVRLEQGDGGDGQVSRATVADTIVAALPSPQAVGTTFEIYDSPEDQLTDWTGMFDELRRDASTDGR
jgi:uncharacterized protein YbjT (DUF2867 family)